MELEEQRFECAGQLGNAVAVGHAGHVRQEADLALQIRQVLQLAFGIRTFQEFAAKHLETPGNCRDLLEEFAPHPASKLRRLSVRRSGLDSGAAGGVGAGEQAGGMVVSETDPLRPRCGA